MNHHLPTPPLSDWTRDASFSSEIKSLLASTWAVLQQVRVPGPHNPSAEPFPDAACSRRRLRSAKSSRHTTPRAPATARCFSRCSMQRAPKTTALRPWRLSRTRCCSSTPRPPGAASRSRHHCRRTRFPAPPAGTDTTRECRTSTSPAMPTTTATTATTCRHRRRRASTCPRSAPSRPASAPARPARQGARARAPRARLARTPSTAARRRTRPWSRRRRAPRWPSAACSHRHTPQQARQTIGTATRPGRRAHARAPSAAQTCLSWLTRAPRPVSPPACRFPAVGCFGSSSLRVHSCLYFYYVRLRCNGASVPAMQSRSALGNLACVMRHRQSPSPCTCPGHANAALDDANSDSATPQPPHAMSATHAKSDDDFDDAFELDADAFDAIEALALTQKPLQVPAANATGQPAPTSLPAGAPPSDDTFSDDSFLLDDETLDAFDAIDAAFEAAQQQQRQQQQQPGQATPPTNTTLPTVLAPAPAPAPVLPPSSPPAASSPTLAQPTTVKSSLKRQHSAMTPSDAAPPRKRARATSRANAQADAREATLRKLIDELQCVVCLQHIVHPHNLPACGHCACAPCINGWFLARVKAGKPISCPVCRDNLPRSTLPMPAYMLRDCAVALVPHLRPDESKAWHERTTEWKQGDWTWKAEPVVQQQVIYEIDDSDVGNNDEDYSGEDDDDDDDDDDADRLSDDDDIQIEVPAARHGTVIRVTALVDLT